MIQPVNGHLLIQPQKHDSFVAQEKGVYEEIGIVISCADSPDFTVAPGTKVYFDSWLAAKYPTGKGDEYFWLVKWDDVRAIEHGKNAISE